LESIVAVEAVDAAISSSLDILQDENKSYQERGLAVRRLKLLKAEPAVPIFIDLLLADNPDEFKDKICNAFLKIEDSRVIEPLLTIFDKSDIHLQITIVKTLGWLKAQNTVPFLIDLLSHEYKDMRCKAVLALGLIGDSRAIDPLVERLQKDDYDLVRSCAAWYLCQFKETRVAQALIEAMQQDTHENVRSRATYSLGGFKNNDEVIDALVSALTQESEDVRWYASDSLGEVGDARAISELERVKNTDFVTAVGEEITVSEKAAKAIEQISERISEKDSLS
jgi:HEAT repeat protein